MIIVGTINGTLPYILSAFNKDPVYELGETWVMGIVAVCLGYFVRGFKDTRSQKDCEYREKRAERWESYDRFDSEGD